MLDFLNIFGLNEVKIFYIQNNNDIEKSSFTLSIPNTDLSEDKKIAFYILDKYFKKFILKYLSKIYLEAVKIVENSNLTDEENINFIVFPIIKKHFKNFVEENEIEIACEIEREKSSFYPTTYNNVKIHIFADKQGTNLIRIWDVNREYLEFYVKV